MGEGVVVSSSFFRPTGCIAGFQWHFKMSENLIDVHIGQFSQKYANQPTWTISDTSQKYYKRC
jgi:hypothetical protein